MLRYYHLRLESDPAVIGVTNGIEQVRFVRGGFADPHRYDAIVDLFCHTERSRQSSFDDPGFDIMLEGVAPLRGAALTDFLSYAPDLPGCPFLVSGDLRRVLSEFNIQPHLFHDARLVGAGAGLPYSLFYCPPMQNGVVDFAGSVFYSGSELVGKTRYTFSKESEYREFRAANPRLLVRAELIQLSSTFDDSLDLFDLVFGGPFISDRLKDALEKAKLIGAHFVPAFNRDTPSRALFKAH